jgi:hypothetical protein
MNRSKKRAESARESREWTRMPEAGKKCRADAAVGAIFVFSLLFAPIRVIRGQPLDLA